MRRWLTAALLTLTASQTFGSNNTQIAFCHDSEDRPPRFYTHGGEWQGRDIDVLNHLFADSPWRYQLDAIPWRRCLKSTQTGKQHQAVLSATYSVARTEHYYFSNSYYSLTPAYLYMASADRETPQITRPTDLYHYRVCGIAGFNYAGFNLSGKQIDPGAKDLSQLVDKLIAGRCDIAVSRFEVIQGLRERGELPWPAGLELRAIPRASLERYYMMVSRNAPNAKQLLRFINHGIERLATPPRDAP